MILEVSLSSFSVGYFDAFSARYFGLLVVKRQPGQFADMHFTVDTANGDRVTLREPGTVHQGNSDTALQGRRNGARGHLAGWPAVDPDFAADVWLGVAQQAAQTNAARCIGERR